jgi:hypothetical protein
MTIEIANASVRGSQVVSRSSAKFGGADFLGQLGPVVGQAGV